MTRLRILLLAPGSNPDGITGPLIGYSHAEALARLHAVTLFRLSASHGSIASMPGLFAGFLGIAIAARF
jgi:hypothetical protein